MENQQAIQHLAVIVHRPGRLGPPLQGTFPRFAGMGLPGKSATWQLAGHILARCYPANFRSVRSTASDPSATGTANIAREPVGPGLVSRSVTGVRQWLCSILAFDMRQLWLGDVGCLSGPVGY
jgi:hypothetical protein